VLLPRCHPVRALFELLLRLGQHGTNLLHARCELLLLRVQDLLKPICCETHDRILFGAARLCNRLNLLLEQLQKEPELSIQRAKRPVLHGWLRQWMNFPFC
jgi:hypothetical protein